MGGFKSTKFQFPEIQQFNLKDSTILLGYRGSVAHGMFVPPSDPYSIDDKDLLGICVPPPQFYFGLKKFEQKESFVNEWDVVIYEFKKYISLLIKNNPNVMSLLWLQPNHYKLRTPWGDMLIENRDLFSSQQAYYSFTGYAHGQLKRMTHFKFEGYMGEKRKKLVERFGYDTKNATHLIRLLRMGIEFLLTEQLNVQRHDAQQLLQIKHGEWTLQQVQEEADRLFKLADEALQKTKLPKYPDTEKIEKMCMTILSGVLFGL